jgi:hypothetical protein
MPDALKKVLPGTPLRIPAEAYNAFVETALAHQHRQLDAAGNAIARCRDATIALVRNDTGADLPRFAVIELDSVIVTTPTDNLSEFHARPLFKALKPTWRQTVHPAITTEPIAAGAIGRACIEGLCSVQLDLPDANRWRHATVRAIDTTKLYAATFSMWWSVDP